MRRSLPAFVVVACLAVAACGPRRQTDAEGPAAAELERLRTELSGLQERFQQAAEKDDQGLSEAPKGGLIIGVPVGFTEEVAAKIVTGFLGELRLRLTNLKVHTESNIRGRVLFRKRTLGNFVLDASIHEIEGELRPGKPRLSFEGRRIGVTLPVRLARGAGRATLRFQWDGKGLAGVACGDIDVSRPVRGSVVPASYVLKGAFDLATEGGSIVLTPRFASLGVRVQIEPAPETWTTVDELVAEQGALCRAALGRIDVKQKIGEVIGRGFPVKLPRRLLGPIRLPAGIEQSLHLQGMDFELDVKPVDLLVTPSRLWYGADIATRRVRGR